MSVSCWIVASFSQDGELIEGRPRVIHLSLHCVQYSASLRMHLLFAQQGEADTQGPHPLISGLSRLQLLFSALH